MVDEAAAIAAEKDLGGKLSALVDDLGTDLLDEVREEIAQLPPGQAKDIAVQALEGVLRARAEVGEHRQRERGLQALFATAHDLISFNDVDEVLREIVDRVRKLFLAEMCFIALTDEETGDAYMRITAGTVERSIESVRQRPGEGIGGEIIRTGRPIWTEDYQNDPAIRRVKSVSEAVDAEGIRSIAGVPLKAGDVTIGALLIANRHTKRFSGAEMAMLSSMGNQAALAIAKAQLFEELEVSARNLRATNAALLEQSAHLERSSATHRRLAALALERVSPNEFVRIVAELVGAEVFCYADEFGELIARHTSPEADARAAGLAGAISAAVSMIPVETTRLPRQDSDETNERWIVPVRAGTTRLGYLYAEFAQPQNKVEVSSLEQSAQTAAILELLERQAFLVEQEMRGELIDDLLNHRGPSWEAIERRAQRSGLLDTNVPHWLVVLTTTGDATRKQLTEACARLTLPIRGLASEYAGDVVAIVPATAFADPHRFVARVRESLRQVAPRAVISGGIGGAASAISELRSTYAEAVRCLRIVLALGRTGEVLKREDLGALGLVLEGTSRARVEWMLRTRIGPLIRYDREHGGMLVETLQAYFNSGQNPRTAAGALYVHPNTVYQRLSRIDHVLGSASWREPGGSLEIQLALQFHLLMQRLPLDEILDEPSRDGAGHSELPELGDTDVTRPSRSRAS